MDVGGVDAVARQQKDRVDGQVRRGHAELTAALVAFHNPAGDAVGASQQLRGLGHITFAQVLADDAAPHRLVQPVDGRHHCERQAQGAGQLAEHGQGTGAVASQGEIRANHQAGDTQLRDQQLEKLFGRKLGQRMVKGLDHAQIHAQRRGEFHAFRG